MQRLVCRTVYISNSTVVYSGAHNLSHQVDMGGRVVAIVGS